MEILSSLQTALNNTRLNILASSKSTETQKRSSGNIRANQKSHSFHHVLVDCVAWQTAIHLLLKVIMVGFLKLRNLEKSVGNTFLHFLMIFQFTEQ